MQDLSKAFDAEFPAEKEKNVIVKSILKDCLQGLEHFNQHFMSHTDLKPPNILFVKKPNGKYIFKLADLGGCVITSSNAESTRNNKSILITEHFQSPELNSQGREYIDFFKSSVYSLGLTILDFLGLESKSFLKFK